MYSANFLRLGFASGEPLGAKTSMKKADGSASGLAVREPRFASLARMLMLYQFSASCTA